MEDPELQLEGVGRGGGGVACPGGFSSFLTQNNIRWSGPSLRFVNGA